MESAQVDAFILFNEKEDAVEKIVHELESRGVSTYFWRRDIPIGEPWSDVENELLKDARCVLVFLGDAGWGPNHLKITKAAQLSKKRILPILIGSPPKSAFDEAGALFQGRRYLDLHEPDAESLKLLVDEIRKSDLPRREASGRFDRLISVLVDGNEEQRTDLLRQIQISKTIDKAGLAARLRDEIAGPFSPNSESQYTQAVRDPKRMSSVRSWMLSSLIWADAEDSDSRALILRHVAEPSEPDRNVRYWTLAGLYSRSASFLGDAVTEALKDSEPEVAALATAIGRRNEPEVIERFRTNLLSTDFDTCWPVLRLLRVVPIPELTNDVCDLLERTAAETALAYDALYALSQPEMARSAVKRLSEHPGVDRTVEIVLVAARGSNQNASKNFAILLAAFDYPLVDRLLKEAEENLNTRDRAQLMRDYLNERRGSPVDDQVFVAGYASDTIDVREDSLGIQEDVQTLTAVMLARDVKPPLAIGLFGDWGTGKSYFMQSMKQTVEELAKRSPGPNARFCSNIAQIEFNAWHYADANLWASLVSFILERLAAYVTPNATPEEQQAALISQLGTAKAIVAEAVAEKKAVEEKLGSTQAELRKLQLERQQMEVKLSDLRISDLGDLLLSDPDLKQELEQSLEEIGVPAAIDSVADLTQVVSEARSARSRGIALLFAILKGKNFVLVIALLVFVLFVIPVAAYVWRQYFPNDLIVRATSLVTQFVAVVTAATALLRRAVTTLKDNLSRVESAKQKVDNLMASKRQKPSEDEIRIQNEIARLRAKEEETSSLLAAAATRVVELEDRIRSINEGRSLARFLVERTSSEDYRKHLGIVSTIRKDFESLAERFASPDPNPDNKWRSVDRIILYIDDLDRCPADKVMDVLQAVHLLLAYPLFVVVVGVDPRWLLHSLGSTYTAFKSDETAGVNPGVWHTTPQNYLEKIFQIPFNLRPMSSPGYGKLISKLLSSEARAETGALVASTASGVSATPATKQERAQENTPDPKPDPDPQPERDPASIKDDPDTQEERQTPEVLHTSEAKPKFMIQEESLIIKTWEAKFAVKLYPLIPSPRAAKRFSNVYRILKARVRREALAQFEGTDEVPGDFQIPMLLLAMLIGAPTESAKVFPKLLHQAQIGKDLMEVLQDLKRNGMEPGAVTNLNEKLRPVTSESTFPNAPDVFLEWIPRVARFSFEVGRVVDAIPKTLASDHELAKQQ